MTTHSNYSLQNFGTSNTRVLTGISQPVSEIKHFVGILLKTLRLKGHFDINQPLGPPMVYPVNM